ncbi:MBL fold metallo-hydrolase [Natranaerobius trueperi]|uniref:MBL fold metallo-hydrolase n=1 Tax=Natranaerobius trueperi TaxID=759412 RepID=UPI001180E6F4
MYRLTKEEIGVEVFCVLTTHAHADHCGGHYWLRKKGVKICAPSYEEAGIKYPILSPLAIYGGAYPPDYFQNKFLKAIETEVDHILITKKQDFLGFEIDVIFLRGHTEGQIGI